MKTVRLADVVQRAGRPEVHPLWLAPKEDRALQTAIRQHRVVTVHQELHGAKKDFAAVGFRAGPAAQYLVFPRSVQRFADRRITAIHYDLLAAGSGGPAKRASAKAKNMRAPMAAEPPTPAGISSAGRARPKSVATMPPEPPVKRSADRKTPADLKPPKASRPADGCFRAEIRRAMQELKAGKTVAAYERLGRLVDGSDG